MQTNTIYVNKDHQYKLVFNPIFNVNWRGHHTAVRTFGLVFFYRRVLNYLPIPRIWCTQSIYSIRSCFRTFYSNLLKVKNLDVYAPIQVQIDEILIFFSMHEIIFGHFQRNHAFIFSWGRLDYIHHQHNLISVLMPPNPYNGIALKESAKLGIL